MASSQIERTLREMVEAEQRKQKQAAKTARRKWFGRRRKPVTETVLRARSRRSDLAVAGLGVLLGVGCAVFPWYIFLNQEKFTVTGIRFGGAGPSHDDRLFAGPLAKRGPPMESPDIAPEKLDLLATGTTDPDAPKELPDETQQPFPGEVPEYRLVYVANGRAMIADSNGLWVVQRGSPLPDNSTVRTIEQRDGAWVLVTSGEKVMHIEP